MPRPYGDPLCVDASNNEYQAARPMSPPLHHFQNRSANGFSYRGGTLVPNGGTGTPLFPSQHHNETPFNHATQHFNNSVNGSHENKLPHSPSNTIIPLDGNVNRSTAGQHSYSNLQVHIYKDKSPLEDMRHDVFAPHIPINMHICVRYMCSKR